MSIFDAGQFISECPQCQLSCNAYALPPQQLPQIAVLYEVSMSDDQPDDELLQQVLEDFIGQYIPAQSSIMLGKGAVLLAQPIGAVMTQLLQDGAEGLSWEGINGSIDEGVVGIAAADEEGNDQTIQLRFHVKTFGQQKQVHGYYNGQQPHRSEVTRYCDLVCRIYSHLLHGADHLQAFDSLIIDRNTRAHIPFMAAHAGFSLAVRPMQAGLALTVANTSIATSTSHHLVDFSFHQLSQMFGNRKAMLSFCQYNCKDTGYEQFQALRRTVRGNFVKFMGEILRSQPEVAASMVFEVSDLLCVSGKHACASSDVFLRFQRHGLNIPDTSQVTHLPLACLTIRTHAIEKVAYTLSNTTVGGDFGDSDSSDHEQPRSKKRKKKSDRSVNQDHKPDVVAVDMNHDTLEMKTDDASEKEVASCLNRFDMLVPMEWLEIVPGYLLPSYCQSSAQQRFMDAKMQQIQRFVGLLGQLCKTNPVMGVQTTQLASWTLNSCQLPSLTVKYRSPSPADFHQYLDQQVNNGVWDLIHPTKYFTYRPPIDAWVTLSLCKHGAGKSSYGVSAAQIEYFLDALCQTMERFGIDVGNLQSTKPIFFPNPNQSKFAALKSIVDRFEIHRLNTCVIVVICPPAMDTYEKAELRWLSLCHFGVPLVLVDISTVYENQPKKNKTERLLGAIAAEINVKSKGQNFKLGHPATGMPGVRCDGIDNIVASEPPEMLSMLFHDVQPYICIGLSMTPIAGHPGRYLYTATCSLDRSLARHTYEACITSHPLPKVDDEGAVDEHCAVLADIMKRILTQCKNLTQSLPKLVMLYRHADAELEWRNQVVLMNERQAINTTFEDFLGPEFELCYVTVSTNHGVELSVAGAWGNVSVATLSAGTLVRQGLTDVRTQQFYLCAHKPGSVDDAVVPRYTVVPDNSRPQGGISSDALAAATYFLCHMHQAHGKVGVLPAPLSYARELQLTLNAYLSERYKDFTGTHSARDGLDRDDSALALLTGEGSKFVEFHPQARSGKMFIT